MGPPIPFTQCSGVRGTVPCRSIRVLEGSSVNASLDCQRLGKVCTSSIFLGQFSLGCSHFCTSELYNFLANYII